MTAINTTERETVIHKAEKEMKRWSSYVDNLLRAFRRCDEAPPSLAYKMEAMRHKRDSVVTKVAALKCHKSSGWTRARKELDEARADLRTAWRSVISTLDKESLFV